MRALYDFAGETSEDLPFSKGDAILVVEGIDNSWAVGEMTDSEGNYKKGMFPLNYVEKIKNLPKASALDASNDSNIPESQVNVFEGLKATLPSIGMAELSSAISGVKLTRTSNIKQENTPKPTEAVGPCGSCGCDEFSPNLFKKGQCKMCFHNHN